MKINKNDAVPLLGFVAFSGTGKTTLLTKLIPLLKKQGLRVALIKHSHHQFEIDKPGKDSYRLRQAGADQVVIAAKKRIAWVEELKGEQEEAKLEDALNALRLEAVDLVLVEGFKGESYPKIELHRMALNKPYLYIEDEDIIAVATDKVSLSLPNSSEIKLLDINSPCSIVSFISQWLLEKRA